MSSPKSKPIRVGDVVAGKYCVERTLGEGGIGIVVRARHLELRQPVAIKALLLRDDDEQVARFMREARASVQLRGEHVAKVTDVGRLADGTPFMVMEYLDGEDLGALAERERVPIGDAVAYVLQACEGIAEAHALGIIHRDIKPRNLFLTRNERGRALVKVLDFGLAKTFGSAGKDSHVTGTMTIAGSPPYMSPEQVRALRDVDVRTDVWSLGVCLYELLSGETPFDAPTIPEVCARVLMDKPTPIEAWLPEVPAGLRDALERCLSKERDRRFANLWELASALEPFAAADAAGAAERIREALSVAPSPAVSGELVEELAPASPDARTLVRTEGETRTAFHTAHERRGRRARRLPAILRTKSRYWSIAVGVLALALLAFSATGVAFRLARGRSSDDVGAITPVAARAELGRTASQPALPAQAPAVAASEGTVGAPAEEAPGGSNEALVARPVESLPTESGAKAAARLAGSASSAASVNGAVFHGPAGNGPIEPAAGTSRRPTRPRTTAHPESQRM